MLNLIDIASSFKSRTVDVNAMKLYFSSLEAVKARAPLEGQVLMLNPFLEKIKSANDIHELFMNMANVWSWFNYRLFDNLVIKFGNDSEKDLVKKYEREKLRPFLKRHVFEMPSTIHSPSEMDGFQKLNVKLSEKIRKAKASELPAIQKRFAQVLEVETHALILTTIKDGCVELCFLVPEKVVQLFPLSDEAINQILNMDWMIISISCGKNTHQVRKQVRCHYKYYYHIDMH